MGFGTNCISNNILKSDDHADNIVDLIFDINFPVSYNNLRATLDLSPLAFSQLLQFPFQLLIVYIV